MKPIPGFPGYWATEDGQIIGRRKRPMAVWVCDEGYGHVSLRFRLGKNPKRVAVHRLVCLAFHGEPKPGQMVRHLDGVKLNTKPSNLVWGTGKENQQDAFVHGTRGLGEDAANVKLTAAQVEEIRALYSKGQTQMSLSAQFGIGQSQISRILRRESWA